MTTIPGLHLHSRYSRAAIAEALGSKESQFWQQGVVPVGKRVLLFVTLDKKDKPSEYRYEDRFLSPSRFHWQSQNQDSQEKRGKKYHNHRENGMTVHLFVRATSRDLEGHTSPFLYLGVVDFIDWEHDNPIDVEWELVVPIPAELWKELSVPKK